MDGSAGVCLLGGYRSDFARDLTKEDRNGNFAIFTAEVVEGPIASADTTAPDVEVVRVANAFGASGSVATLAALADLRSGADDAALMAGIGNATTFGTLNFGGSAAATVSVVVSQPEGA